MSAPAQDAQGALHTRWFSLACSVLVLAASLCTRALPPCKHTRACVQMSELRLWPVLGQLDAEALRSGCLSLFRPEWLPGGTVLYTSCAAVPQNADTAKLTLLVRGTVLCGMTAAGGSGKEASQGHGDLVVTGVVRSKQPGMALMLGLEALCEAKYHCSYVCKCASPRLLAAAAANSAPCAGSCAACVRSGACRRRACTLRLLRRGARPLRIST